MIRVLLVDDHPIVRSGYHHLLQQTGDISVISQAGSAEEGYSAWLADAPDVCVTDLSLPGIGGLELMAKILARDAAARVLVFSMHDSPHLVRRALDAGASGFVSKQAAPENLVAAVRAAHAGERFLSAGLSPQLLKRTVDDETARLDSLSRREFEIFRLLSEGRSPAECALILNLSSKTVSNNQTQIKEKLDLTTSAALVHFAQRNGIIARRDER